MPFVTRREGALTRYDGGCRAAVVQTARQLPLLPFPAALPHLSASVRDRDAPGGSARERHGHPERRAPAPGRRAGLPAQVRAAAAAGRSVLAVGAAEVVGVAGQELLEHHRVLANALGDLEQRPDRVLLLDLLADEPLEE